MLSQKAQHRSAKQANQSTTPPHAFLDSIDLSNAFLAAQGLPPSQKATHCAAKQAKQPHYEVDASVKRKLF
jgi:hypothetical protein